MTVLRIPTSDIVAGGMSREASKITHKVLWWMVLLKIFVSDRLHIKCQ